MNECINYNCDVLPVYNNAIAGCGSETRVSGASTIYLIECDNALPADPGSQADIDALVEAGGAVEISNVRIGFNEPTAITSDSIALCGSVEEVSYIRSASLEDSKVSPENSIFWEAAKRRSFAGAILIECETTNVQRQVTVIDAEIIINAYRDFPNNNEQTQKYIVKINWKKLQDPAQYPYTP